LLITRVAYGALHSQHEGDDSMIGLGRIARLALPAAASVLLSISIASADEIGDAITAAADAYKAGELATAKQSLDLASQLIAQQTADALVAALPKPLAGWKAGEADTSSGGAFGFSMTQASREYTNAKGDSVEVSIATDSPFLTQLAAAMANPQLAGFMGKMVTISGTQRGIQTKEGEVQMLVNNRYVINVSGGGTADEKLNYAKSIDFGVLGKMK
jgi:hypothetical protein